jgi:hypothetical protein
MGLAVNSSYFELFLFWLAAGVDRIFLAAASGAASAFRFQHVLSQRQMKADACCDCLNHA